MKVRIAGIAKDSIVDGPGLRHAVFFQGCGHACEGCHNRHTWDPCGGEEADVDDIVSEAVSDPLCCGVTLTGGEPLDQPEAACEIARRCKEAGLSVWLYTGCRFEDVCHIPVFWWVDVCVDGPFVKVLKQFGLGWRGSSNQRLVDVEEWRKTGEVSEWKDEKWKM